MQSFEFIDLILFLGISQGLFLAFTLQVLTKKNKAANKILSIILWVTTITLFGRMVYSRFSDNLYVIRIVILVDVIIFVLGPLSYLYMRKLVFEEKLNFRKILYHFIPVFFHLAFVLWSYTRTIPELHELIKQGALNFPFFVIETIGLISNIVYIFLCLKLIKLYSKERKENLSYMSNLLPFLYTYIVSISLFVTAWFLSYINFNIYYFNLKYISYNLVWILISVFVYVVSFYSLKQPEIFRMPLTKKNKIKNKERLCDREVAMLKDKLEELLVDEKIYLNHKLTLVDLAKKLDTTTNNVSWLLNNIHNCAFYDYINKYRVREFISKIHNGEHHNHTLLALSMDSGFNSKSTFNKAFKAEFNDTPSNYIKRLNIT